MTSSAGNARLAALVLAASAGCSASTLPCFAPSSVVVDNQIVGVSADPPESVFDPTGSTPVQPINVAVLAVTGVQGTLGEYGRAVRVTAARTVFRICLEPTVEDVDAQPGCPPDSAIVGDLPTVPTESVPFSYTPPADLLNSALAADPLHGLAGIHLRLEIDIDTSSSPLTATKTLSFLLQGSPETLNHSLQLTGMEVSNQGDHSSPDPARPLDLFVDQTTGLRPLIGPAPGQDAAVETYLAYDNQGQLTSFQEHVTYAFYSGNALYFGQTPGEVAIYTGAPGAQADEPAPGATDPPDGLVSVEPVFPGDQGGSFWVVARDDRGAITWREVTYFAKELRAQCSNFTQLMNLDLAARCAVKLFICN